MHGNNPTRDYIEGELTRHAAAGRIRSWKRLPLNYGGAPKWEVELTLGGVPPDGTVPIRTYQEGKLVCAALASAEQAEAQVTRRLREWLDHQAAHDGFGLSSQRWAELDRIAGR